MSFDWYIYKSYGNLSHMNSYKVKKTNLNNCNAMQVVDDQITCDAYLQLKRAGDNA